MKKLYPTLRNSELVLYDPGSDLAYIVDVRGVDGRISPEHKGAILKQIVSMITKFQGVEVP